MKTAPPDNIAKIKTFRSWRNTVRKAVANFVFSRINVAERRVQLVIGAASLAHE